MWFCIYVKKHCRGCDQVKPVSDFWLKKGLPQARCKECQRNYHKQHYLENARAYKDRAVRRNRQVRTQLREAIDALKAKPCMDCGRSYPPYVMDFDHRDAATKKFTIAAGTAVLRLGLEKILEEIQKCDLVCANCHRIRTHARMTRPSGPGRRSAKPHEEGSIPSRVSPHAPVV